MTRPDDSRIVITARKLYHTKPYDGPRLIIVADGKVLISGENCEIRGVIVREEPAPFGE